MMVKAYVGHKMENRTRFYLPSEIGNEEVFVKIREQVLTCPGVVEAQINVLTGSVLILHESTLEGMIEYVQLNGIFEVDPSLKPQGNWGADLISKVSKIDKKIVEATDGDLSLVSLAALGLFGAGAYQLSRRQFFPAASTLITDAMRILVHMNRTAKQAQPTPCEE